MLNTKLYSSNNIGVRTVRYQTLLHKIDKFFMPDAVQTVIDCLFRYKTTRPFV